MEDWLQTEWPHLRVHVTSVTEQWATFPVVGPRSRDVVAAVTGLDTSQGGVPVHDLAGHPDRRTCGCGWPGSASPASSRSRSTSTPGTRLAVWERADRGGGAATASPPTAPRRCTCCARRRPTRSSGRTPTARSPRRTWGCPGRCRRRRRTSSASGRSPAADNNRADRKHLVGLLPGGPHRACCPRARRSSRAPLFPNHPCPCSGTSPRATAAPSWTGAFALALVKARPDPHRADGARARRGRARPRGDHRARPRRPRRSPP